MSDPFNRLLLSPKPEELAAALDQASGREPGAESVRRWRPILDELAATAEGRSQLQSLTPGVSPARYLSVAWWADHQGRKLVRVCGGYADRAQPRHYSRMDRDLRPPVWHVGPERVYRVRRPGAEPQWLACCACGEVGRPEQIAWDGERCGGCHDRREEGLAVDERPALVEIGASVYDVAFVEGDRIAVTSEGRTLELLGRGDEAPAHLFFDGEAGGEWEELRPLVATADGRWLAVVDPRHELVRLWRVRPGGTEELRADTPDDQVDVALGLTFSPDGKFLAVCQGDGGVVVWERVADQWQACDSLNTAFSPDGVARSAAFLAVGQVLALGRRSGLVTLLELDLGDRESRIRVGTDEEVAYVAQPRDGQHLVLVTVPGEGEDPLRRYHGPERAQLRLWDFASQSEVHSHALLPPSLLALSPNGGHLAWVTHHLERSPAEVVFWDVRQWRGAGALEWDSEDMITALAFSLDGEEIATGSQSGAVKWWPWRRLLGG